MNIKANPNPTNSEMDSKTIIKHPRLNDGQRDELIEQFVELQVDSMDMESLVEWVTDELILKYEKLTKEELKERIDCYDEGLFEELVDNVTNETVLDINNTGGKY